MNRILIKRVSIKIGLMMMISIKVSTKILIQADVYFSGKTLMETLIVNTNINESYFNQEGFNQDPF